MSFWPSGPAARVGFGHSRQGERPKRIIAEALRLLKGGGRRNQRRPIAGQAATCCTGGGFPPAAGAVQGQGSGSQAAIRAAEAAFEYSGRGFAEKDWNLNRV